MRIAIVVRDLPRATGFGLVVENLLSGLAQDHIIRVFILHPGYYKPRTFDADDWPYEYEEYVASDREEERAPRMSRASHYYNVQPARLVWLNTRIGEYRADRIVGFDYNLAPYLGMLESSAPKVLNVIDSEILYYGNQLRYGNVKISIIKHLVAAFFAGRENFAQCAALVTVSPSDTSNIKRWTGIKNAFTVPNGVDDSWYAPNPSIEKKQSRIVFCGSLSFLPNVQAVDWFLSKCWHKILSRVPAAEFLIIGKNPPIDLAQRFGIHRGVHLVGEVDDIRAHILSSSVSVAPMVSGTGIKNKILEAWALAVPVVATRRAVEGLICEHAKNIIISDSAGQFAKNVVFLLSNPEVCDRIGKAGRSHAIRTYSWTASRAAFNSIVNSAPQIAT